MKELASVERLLARGIELSPAKTKAAHAELVTLVEPFLPVLVHKRKKSFGQGGSIDDAHWFAELYHFAGRWPHLTPNAAARGRLVVELDKIVCAEHKRLADEALSPTVPVTSRFDTSWAT